MLQKYQLLNQASPISVLELTPIFKHRVPTSQKVQSAPISGNVEASTSRYPKGLHGLYRDNFTLLVNIA
jgi:hypothetical protein